MVITPSSAQLAPGARIEFTAFGSGTTGGVTWSATGGSIDETGLKATYTAPSQTGDFTVTVTGQTSGSSAAAAVRVIAAGAAQSLWLSADALTFTQLGEERRVELTAIDAQNQGAVVPSDMEWTVTPQDAFSVVVDSNDPQWITIKSLRRIADATLQGRSASLGLSIQPVSLVSAVLKPQVQPIQDNRVVFPPAQATLSAKSDIRDVQGVTMIGSFKAEEVLTLIESGSLLSKPQFPVVLRVPTPTVGSILASVDGASIYGTVMSSTERDGFALVQLQQVGPKEVFDDLVLSLDAGTEARGVTSQKLTLQDVKFEFKRDCISGSLDPTFIDSVSFPKVDFAPSIRGNIDVKQGIYSFKVRLDFGSELKIALKYPFDVSGNLTCNLSKPVTIELPRLAGPASLIWNAAVVLTPKATLDTTLKLGAPIDFGITAKGDGFIQAGFDCQNDICSDATDHDFTWDPKAWNNSTLTADIQSRRASFSTTAGVFFNEKIVAEFGLPMFKACDYLEKTPLAFVTTLKEKCDSLRKRLLLSILEADVGGEASMKWDSARLAVEKQSNNSEASAHLVGRLSVGDGINKALNILQFKAISSPLVEIEVPLGHLFRPYIVETFEAKVNNQNSLPIAKSGATVLAFPGDVVSGSVRAQLTPVANAAFDSPLTAAELWISSASDTKQLNLSKSSISGTTALFSADITKDICDLGQPVIHVIGFSSMFGIKTASYLGDFRPYCKKLTLSQAINPRGRYLDYITPPTTDGSVPATRFSLNLMIEGTDIKISDIYERCFNFFTQGHFLYGEDSNAKAFFTGVVFSDSSGYVSPGPRSNPRASTYNGKGYLRDISQDFETSNNAVVAQIPTNATSVTTAPPDFPLYDNASDGPFNLIITGPVDCPIK